MPDPDLIQRNRDRDLYLFDATVGRVVFVPQGWCDQIPDPCADEPDAEPSVYGWYGNPDVSAWEGRADHEFLTTDAQAWFTVAELSALVEIPEAGARQLDPDLFRLLDAVNSGRAV